MSGRGHILMRLIALLSVLFLLAGLTYVASAAPPAQSVEAGQALFQEQCSACHTIGGGTLVGPDLQGVTTRRDRDWLIRWITAPERMLEQGDPIATELYQQYNQVPMPNLGLTETDVSAVLAYIESQSSGATGESAGQPTAETQQITGDPVIGRDYFTGAKRFQNGGPACIACHSVTGIGALGGGALGPDLTPAFNKYGGAAGLDAFLAGTPTQTMNAVWAPRRLTPQERGHLVAFLQQASVAGRSASAIGQLTALATVGALLFLGVIHVSWRRRL